MAWHLTVGPPGSGRTTLMVEAARAACDAGKRVWWVGLPTQRSYVLSRVTANGYVALGLEVMSAQQLYYRLLTAAGRLRPLVIGSGRLVRVVEALRQVVGALPTPGEAHLFATAIAEAKRFGVSPEQYAANSRDAEQRRFAAVYSEYASRLQSEWDYDDVRQAAVELAGADAGGLECEADLIIVDGLRELGPLELRLFQALARRTEVRVTLSSPPPGLRADETLGPEYPVQIERYLAPNPVAEARWVLRSLKHDLLVGGFAPLELALITTESRARAWVTLAEEYGVPLMDETPLALTDSVNGQRLVDLLELADHPTPSRLLALPELRALAGAALSAGVAGSAAIGAVAQQLGMHELWRRWLERLEVSGEPVAWARQLLQEVMAAEDELDPQFVEEVLAKAQEAARLGSGPGFRAWWAALLRDSRAPRREPVGVALITPNLASGRRFRKAYLTGAVEGAFGAGEREDYFLPEEQRSSSAESFARLGLPRRFQGRLEAVVEELLTRADELVVTAAHADQSGPLVADEALLGASPEPLPPVAAGSLLELARWDGYRASLEAVPLGEPTVERLDRYRVCSFRLWGESLADEDGEWLLEAPAWQRLRRDLYYGELGERNSRLSEERLTTLEDEYPEFAGWLRAHRERLLRLTYNVVLGGRGDNASARLHAAERSGAGSEAGERATLYRFVEPGAADDAAQARDLLYRRWNEYWAAGLLYEQRARPIERVDIVVWPLLGEPLPLFDGGVPKRHQQVRQARQGVREQLPLFLAGRVKPTPGFQCRDCPVFDLCREGVR